ncbi:MAG: hypothetical protein DWQ47_14615 [Acidobacteria bacterium]|nr:MAG: hypothetical protein DWQ32_02015 [Acidobacteriota bacterium]REK02701.1 MAG: hypothetical protein DWQ38_10120 [Acidobacteriota bacterium]REK13494.1 MAG: hypothetical protein DWQ43_07705 [Acidobacteriota bacterium]REK41488.1 MAG: hypothetical protein DWQ47_14615 [Acidobacteriota bacterium]
MSTGTATDTGLNQPLIAELQHESAVTRTVLERVPTDKLEFKPHEKSMGFGQLASHIAEMYEWFDSTLNQTELDFATMEYEPFIAKSNEELLEYFDSNVEKALEFLKKATDEELMVEWTMRNGDTVYFSMPRIQVVRSFILNHIVHHRGQLSVYLRLNDIPVPQIYGPSADEGQM